VTRLHAIVDVDAALRAGWSAIDLAQSYLDGGATLLQIRAKALPSGEFLDICDAVVKRATPCDASIVVNDRVDLALMSGAAGVHVGQDDVPPADARRLLGPAAIVGYSTHTTEQIDRAVTSPASYIAVGPVFGTTTKDTGYAAVGLELVREAVARGGGRPVVAIGGITLEGAPSVLAAGASAVAVIGDLLKTGDPKERVASYLRALA
jgi:thiamine-phosphate pyrophosphorylase